MNKKIVGIGAVIALIGAIAIYNATAMPYGFGYGTPMMGHGYGRGMGYGYGMPMMGYNGWNQVEYPGYEQPYINSTNETPYPYPQYPYSYGYGYGFGHCPMMW